MKNFSELKQATNSNQNYIVENLIREKGLYCLLGCAKVGKSSLALQIANSVCNGLNFLDLRTKKTNVLYISTEMTQEEIYLRANLMNCNLDDKFYYYYPTESGAKIKLFDLEREISNFKNQIDGKLVIIDMFNGIDFGYLYDINNYQDMSSRIFPLIRKLADKYDVAILFTHHLNRREKPLGSTAIESCVDGYFSLTFDEHDNETFYLKSYSRDFADFEYILSRKSNLILTINNDESDNLPYELIQLIKICISKKELTFTISEMVQKLNLQIKPSSFGKMINKYQNDLLKEGLTITQTRIADERLYTAIYKEPIDLIGDNNVSN